MAELSSYLWIVPHMRSFYVPPKYSAPLTRGLFCDLDFLRRENEKAPAGDAPRPADRMRHLAKIDVNYVPYPGGALPSRHCWAAT